MISLIKTVNCLLICLLLGPCAVLGQAPARLHRITVKAGVNTSYQILENVPTYRISVLSSDTSWRSRAGSYNRAGISFMVYSETHFSSKVAIVVGLGYRQKGFASNGTYSPATGIISPAPAGSFEEYKPNRLDYLAGDVGVKVMPFPGGRLQPYVLLLNRVGALVGMKVPFWETPSGRYGGYRQFEYSPALAGGVEFSLKTVVFKGKTGEPARPNSRIVAEVEYNPGVMNVHKGTDRYVTNSPLQVKGTGSPSSLPVVIGRNAYNHSFSLMLGLVF